MELAQTVHPLQQKSPIPFTCCYLIHNRFIYMRFSLINNIQVEVVSSLPKKTTGSIERQHLLEAEVEMPYNLSFLSRSLTQRSSGNKICILVSLCFPSKPADWFLPASSEPSTLWCFNQFIFQWAISWIFYLDMLGDCLIIFIRRYASLEREKLCGILSV